MKIRTYLSALTALTLCLSQVTAFAEVVELSSEDLLDTYVEGISIAVPTSDPEFEKDDRTSKEILSATANQTNSRNVEMVIVDNLQAPDLTTNYRLVNGAGNIISTLQDDVVINANGSEVRALLHTQEITITDLSNRINSASSAFQFQQDSDGLTTIQMNFNEVQSQSGL